MIFLTVGTQFGFDRLVRSVDNWSAGAACAEKVFAQIGDGVYEPVRITWKRYLSPKEYEDIFFAADIIVSHAGMGTIIQALTYGKPIVVLPRKAEYGEHRNNHQMATYERFKGVSGVYFMRSEDDLAELLGAGIAGGSICSSRVDDFVSRLRSYIES